MESLTPFPMRNRKSLLALSVLILSLGWLTRRYASTLPAFLGSYAPDTFWALLIFLLVLLVRPGLTTRHAFGTALLFSYGIEVSQLVQVPWLNAIRDTTMGGLVLGHGFLWTDLLCYTIGITLGALVDARFAPCRS